MRRRRTELTTLTSVSGRHPSPLHSIRRHSLHGLVFLLCLSGTALFSCKNAVADGPAKPLPKPHRATAARPLEPFLTAPPRELRETLAKTYALAPDRRFLLAFGAMEEILTEAPAEGARAEYGGGKWTITCGDVAVGELPSYPDYEDFAKLLDRWAWTLLARHPLPTAKRADPAALENLASGLRSGSSHEAMKVIRRAEAIWSEGHDPAVLVLASRGALTLAIQTRDSLEVADPLFGRTIALLTLARVLGGQATLRDESLLAYTLGYTTCAEIRAAQLLEADPARSFVLRKDDPLLASAKSGDPWARYLWLCRLAENGDQDGWLAWAREHYSSVNDLLPAIDSALDLDSFYLNQEVPRMVPALILYEMKLDGAAPEKGKGVSGGTPAGSGSQRDPALVQALKELEALPTSQVIDSVEREIKALGARSRAGLLDGRALQAYYESHLFTALDSIGRHFLDELSSAEAAQSFSRDLGEGGEPVAADFRSWYAHLAASAAGSRDPSSLLGDLSKLEAIGAGPLLRTCRELTEHTSFADFTLIRMARVLAGRLDTRPAHRAGYLTIAYTDLKDLALAEDLARSLAAQSPALPVLNKRWLWRFLGDKQKLTDLLNDRRLEPADRAMGLEWLCEHGDLPFGEVQKRYLDLRDATRDNWEVTAAFARFLVAKGKPADADALVQEWIRRNPDRGDGFERIFAHNMLAYHRYLQGQYAEAWTALKPVSSSWQAGTMARAALILERLGRKAEAEQYARDMVERYPDQVWARQVAEIVFWRMGKNDEAAALMEPGPYTNTPTAWGSRLAARFYYAFKDAPDDRVLAAYGALLQHKVAPMGLIPVCLPFAKAKRYALAFEMGNRLQPLMPQTDGTFWINSIHTYHFLKVHKGPQEAMRWLDGQTQGRTRVNLLLEAFGLGEYEVLWGYDAQLSGDYAIYAWVLRATASLRTGTGNDPHRKELEAHFANAGNSHYDKLGRYMMGTMKEEDVLALADTKPQRSEVCFYLASRAACEGRMKDAMAWYRLCMEMGDTNSMEYTWAGETLDLWKSKETCLSNLVIRPQDQSLYFDWTAEDAPF